MERYDESTGQVYVQKTLAANSMKTFQWVHHSTRDRYTLLKYRNFGKGAASMLQMASRAFAFYADGIEPGSSLVEDIKDVAPHVIRGVFEILKETRTGTPWIWSLLKHKFPEEVDDVFDVRIVASQGRPAWDLDLLGPQLRQTPFQSLTFLDICGLEIRREHLLSDLLKVPALAFLAIKQARCKELLPYEGGDRLVLNWGRAVEEKEAFTKLRVLVLENFDLSEHALGGLDRFPALYLVHLGSRVDECLNPAFASRPAGDSRIWCEYVSRKPTKGCSTIDDPNHIWLNRLALTRDKMARLYDLASRELKAEHSIEADHNPTIMFSYGDSIVEWTDRGVWFKRIRMPGGKYFQEHGSKQERPRSDEGASKKRRKLNTKKSEDVAAMLSQFMGS